MLWSISRPSLSISYNIQSISSILLFSPFRTILKKLGRFWSVEGCCWIRRVPAFCILSNINLWTFAFWESVYVQFLNAGGTYQKHIFIAIGSLTISNISGCFLNYWMIYSAFTIASSAIFLKPSIPCLYRLSHNLKESACLPQLSVLSPRSYLE